MIVDTHNLTSECYSIVNPFYQESIMKAGELITSNKNSSALEFTFYGIKKERDEKNLAQFPLMVYLAGGPGLSSQFGYVTPTYIFNNSGQLIEKEKNITWNSLANLLVIDEPIGTGGSVYSNESEIPYNSQRASEHLYFALLEFFKMEFGSKFLESKLYLFGISYAGKFVANLAKEIIIKNNDAKNKKINLIGIGLGNPWMDPQKIANQEGNLGYFNAFIDLNEKMRIEQNITKFNLLISKGDFISPWHIAFSIIVYLGNYVDIYDKRGSPDLWDEEHTLIESEINTPAISQLEHIKNKFIISNAKVFLKFENDFMRNEGPTLEYILNNSEVNVLIYQGTDDLIVPPSGTIEMAEHLNFNKNDNSKSDFQTWTLQNGTIAGESKKVGNLELRMVLNSCHLGHYPDAPQPASEYDMLFSFLNRRNNIINNN